MHKSRQNGHYALIKVNYVGECCAECADEPICLSCDDINKIHVGTLAVSHYHQIHSFLPVENRPICSDHDFLFSNLRII